MKATKKMRLLSAVLATVMILVMLPFGMLTANAVSETNFYDEPTKQLGIGYNALENNIVSTETLTGQNWLDYDISEAFVSSNGDFVLSQGSKAFYAKSSLELLTKFGINYSKSASVNMPIDVAKVGIERKFSLGLDTTVNKTYDELYYNYTYRAVYNRYTLNTRYASYLSNTFLNAIKNIDPKNDLSIAAFYRTYGTHMLTAFSVGGELNMSAWAYSETEGVTIDASLEDSATAKASIGEDVSASAANSVKLSFHNNKNTSGIKTGILFDSVGGSSIYVDTVDPESFTLDTDTIASWVTDLADKTVFLPETSSWVPVWEVLPSEAAYEEVRTALYNYFVEHASADNLDFIERFCSFNDRIAVDGFTYLSADGNVALTVPYETVNYVAPGSTVMMHKTIKQNDLVPLDSLTYEIDPVYSAAGVATIDRNGVIRVASNAADGAKISVNICSGGITVYSATFDVMREGGGYFAGGYGSAARPYLISEAAHLQSIANTASLATSENHFMLQNDISLASLSGFNGIPTFNGTLDGNGYKIYAFSLSTTRGSFGLIHVNNGTVKNLTVGNTAAKSDAYTGYSAQILTSGNEASSETRNRIGGLVGYNNGLVDNCHAESLYFASVLSDINNNENAYIMMGTLVGDNRGTVTRGSAFDSTLSTRMPAKENSGDNNRTYIGGVIGANYGTAQYLVSAGNNLHARADGNGTGGVFKEDNYAEPTARAAGLIGYANGGSTLSDSVAYGNALYANTVPSNSDVWTHENEKTGALVGHQEGTCTGCYALSGSDSNISPAVNGSTVSIVGSGSSTGCTFSATNEALCALFAGNQFFSVAAEKPVLTSMTALSLTYTSTTYIVNDHINLTDLVVWPMTAGNVQMKEYNATEKVFVTATQSNFRLTGFSTATAGAVDATVTGYGGLTAAYSVTVLPRSVSEVAIARPPYKNTYFTGEEIDTAGLWVKLIYNDNSTELTTDYTIGAVDNTVAGAKSVTVTVSGLTASFPVDYYYDTPATAELATMPTKTNYAKNESFDGSGLEIHVTYNSGKVETVTPDKLTFSGFDSREDGAKEVTATYTYRNQNTGKQQTLAVTFTVNVGTVIAVEVSKLPNKLSYYTSSTRVDTTGLELKLTYSNEVERYVTAGFDRPTGIDFSTPGTKEVSITFAGISTYYDITVEEVMLQSISVSHPAKTQYYIDEKLTTSGLCLELVYNDGSTHEAWSGYTVQVEGYDEGVLPTFPSTGTKTVSVYYIENGMRRATSYTVTVSQKMVSRIEISQLPYKTIYKQGETLSTDGILVNVIFNNGEVTRATGFEVYCELNSLGTQIATVRYLNYTTTFAVTVVAPAKLVISKEPTKTEYTLGETLDLTGLCVNAVYYDGTYLAVSPEQLEADVNDLLTEGNVPVSISFAGLTASFFVTVSRATDAPTIIASNVAVTQGKTAKMTIDVSNNPGFSSLVLTVKYDTALFELVSCQNGSIISDFDHGTNLMWSADSDAKGNGTLVTLIFKAKENTPLGNYPVSVLFRESFNAAGAPVSFYTEDTTIQVLDYSYGDVNGDNEINGKDVVLLRQYIANYDYDTGASTVTVSAGADVNADGAVDTRDLILMRQYIANYNYETGDSTVILGQQK